MSARFIQAFVPALAAAAALALIAPATQAQPISPVTVRGHLPTEVRLNVRGMDRQAVVKVVSVAAKEVCRNAFDNRQMDLGDYLFCADKSATKAIRHYDGFARRHVELAGGLILAAS
jgi:hypothetical protein